MKFQYCAYCFYPLALMIPYDFMVIDLDMYILDVALKQLPKNYFSHQVIQSSILHLRTTRSSCTRYQNLSLKHS